MIAHLIPACLLAVAFFGAGVFNMIGTAATRTDFVRWGYPVWWCRVTGGLEMGAAALTAVPATRSAGLGLGAIILATAVVTVVRHREYSHLAPLGFFAILLGFCTLTI